MRAKRSAYFLTSFHRPWVRYGALLSVVAAGFAVGIAQRGASDRVVSTSREGAMPAAPAGSISIERTPSRTQRDPNAMSTSRAPSVSHPSAVSPAKVTPRRREPAVRDHGHSVASAERELERLQAQEPTNFLAIFDMMHDEGRWNDGVLDSARRASHAYILARMGVLDRMLRRYIDDPESDKTVESDDLARIDAEFQTRMESLARDVPPLENVQALLTTTILKAPAFTEPPLEPE